MKHIYLFNHQLNTKYLVKDAKVYLFEVAEEYSYEKFHSKRIVLLKSALRHFHLELIEEGYDVVYHKVNEYQEVLQLLRTLNFTVTMFHPSNEYHLNLIQKWKMNLSIELFEDPMFIIPLSRWKKELIKPPFLMYRYYQKFRKELGILMESGKPVGGKYSFDAENRKKPNPATQFHDTLFMQPDELTCKVIEEVSAGNYKEQSEGFSYAVTKTEAEKVFQHFIEYRLSTFGDYQDAMIEGNAFMSHSLVSPYMNIGLLDPLAMVKQVEEAYKNGLVTLAAAEGFIRQVLGWREYIRAVYVTQSPGYHLSNYFDHQNDLPIFYYSGETELNCLKQTIEEVKENGYNHHIQRLMILSNYSNLIEVEPQQLYRWFLEMYVDSQPWVVAPNVIGMGLFADGGLMSTKPYIASSNYINNMSTYCKKCIYTPKPNKENTCPIYHLYYYYLVRHETLRENLRMKLMYRSVDKKEDSILLAEKYMKTLRNGAK